MEDEKIIRTLNKADKQILQLLQKEEKFADEIELSAGLEKSAVVNSGRKMLSLGLVKISGIISVNLSLTVSGKNYLEEGLPELRIYNFIQKHKGVEYKQLFSDTSLDKNEIAVAIGSLKKNDALKEENGRLFVKTEGGDAIKTRQDMLAAVAENKLNGSEDVQDLIKRGIIADISKIRDKFSITDLGRKIINNKEFSAEVVDKLSVENIRNWQNLRFREYSSRPEILDSLSGKLNVKTKFSNFIKNVMLSIGFREMHSNYVESVFWNFDVMMFRQGHPDRDIQDTVYLNGGEGSVPKDILSKVKSVYEHGFKISKYNESTGYDAEFDTSKSNSLIMRGHTTSTTFRYLHEVISKNPDKPAKFFSIDKSFRNETMDNTHLLELYQIEGIVYDDNLTVADLIGYIKDFYSRIGIDKIRLKPTYNPYTEPSLEIQAFSPKLKRWIELGNSGVFRPETLYPFGIKKNIIAWGFGMERMLNLKLELADIRDLYGAYTDIDLLRSIESARIFSEI